jgi:NAD(P)-dependent dehydrogenase (short-subunit alcohol dehydrogenase family)
MPFAKPSSSEQKVVLITGATSGIGQACAEHLAGLGWRVFGTRRASSAAPPNETRFEMITMDVDDDASVQSGVETLLAKTGRLDAVVNNAGIALMGPIEDTSTEEAKAQMETNFFGVLRVCRATLPALRKQGGGHIVNVSSLAAVVGLPFSGLYSASKFALEGMSESLRHEARPFGIRVVLVEPGDFHTAITSKRRTTQASQTNDAYRETFVRFKQKQDQDEAQAPSPHSVAVLIEWILNNPRPHMRYTVGMMGQRIVVPLKRFLPQRLFEWLFRRVVGL